MTLPNGWTMASLRDVAEINPAKDPITVDPDAAMAFVPMASVREELGGIDVATTRPFSEVRKGYVQFREHDVLFAKITPCMENGKIGVVPKIASPVGYGSTEFHVLRPDQGINPRWITHYLSQDGFRRIARRNMSGSAGQLRVPEAWLAQQSLPIAPSEEQERIVAKLEELISDLDAGASALQRANENLKRYRAAVLNAAVEGRLTEKWRAEHPDVEPAWKVLERMLAERRKRWEEAQLRKHADKGRQRAKNWSGSYPEPQGPDMQGVAQLPARWAWATVDQLSLVVRGASPRPAGDPRYFGGSAVPWITVGSLTEHDEEMYLMSVKEFLTEQGREHSRYIEADTLLLTNSGATLGVPKITRIGGCINDGSVALLGLDESLRKYLYYFLRTRTKSLRSLNQGAAQPNLNTSIVKAIVVPLPPREERDVIVSHLDELESKRKASQEFINNAALKCKSLRMAILKRAFEGKLVPQDPNDEPASEFLAAIRRARKHVEGGGERQYGKRGTKATQAA